jgi:hypothetical protein
MIIVGTKQHISLSQHALSLSQHALSLAVDKYYGPTCMQCAKTHSLVDVDLRLRECVVRERECCLLVL